MLDQVLLGRILKAMYKTNGDKTLNDISEETGLSVDTINNLMYGRLQKPSFLSVCKMVEATGYTLNDLYEFLSLATALPESADITEEFVKYIHSVEATVPTVPRTKAPVDPAPSPGASPVAQKVFRTLIWIDAMLTTAFALESVALIYMILHYC